MLLQYTGIDDGYYEVELQMAHYVRTILKNQKENFQKNVSLCTLECSSLRSASREAEVITSIKGGFYVFTHSFVGL